MRLLHRATVRRATLPVSVILALAFGLVLAMITPASAVPSATTSTLRDGGVLRIGLGADDYVWLQRPDPAAPGSYLPLDNADKQTISVTQGCKLTLSGPNLVKTSPSGNNLYAGFFDNSIGVGSRNEGNGQPCGRIDQTQKLTLDLGTALSGKMIDFAEIDIEGKFGATIQVQGFFVDPADPLNPVAVDPAPIEYPTTGADSSPDSGDLDNYRIRYPKTGFTLVNRLEFTVKAPAGGASLEGGSDGTLPCSGFKPDGGIDLNSEGCSDFSLGADALGGTTDSLFHLTEVEGFLDCGDDITDDEPNDGIGLRIERLLNADGTCGDPIPYNLSGSTDPDACTSSQCIFLQKDLLGQDDARFYWTVTWAPTTEEYMPGATEFDFGDGRGFHALDFCLADDNDTDPDPELPDNGDPWCVVSTSSTLDPATGDVTVKELYFGTGDPTGRR